MDIDDILQEGYLGLWKACLSYDKHKGTAFSTYAVPCIRTQIFMAMRNTDIIRIPKYFKDLRKALYNHGFTLPLDPIEVDVLISEGKFSRMQVLEFSNFSVSSLDDNVSDDNDCSLYDLIEDRSANIDYQFSDEEIEIIINQVLSYIKPTNRDMIEEWMYATFEGTGVSQVELAKKYNTTRSNVSRAIKSAVYLFKQNVETIRNLFGV